MGARAAGQCLIAAPVAVWLARHIPPRVLGWAVGGVIVLTNVRMLLRSDWIDASDAVKWPIYDLIYVVCAAALAYSIQQHQGHLNGRRSSVSTLRSCGHGQ